MRWRDTAFKFRYNAELCKKHLEQEGIKYVVADSSDEAWTKIVAFFEKQRNEGLMFPQLITELGVEIDEVIL